MLYTIISEDVENSLGKRRTARPAHIKRLEDLQNQGRLVLAGPHPTIDCENPGDAGFSGSLIVAEFQNLEAAKKWADTDPYVSAGVYNNMTVKPFKKVFPK